MSILLTIIIGFFIGVFARILMPGKDVTGFIMTTLLGIGGALVGKFIGQGLGLYAEGQTAGFFYVFSGSNDSSFYISLDKKEYCCPKLKIRGIIAERNNTSAIGFLLQLRL